MTAQHVQSLALSHQQYAIRFPPVDSHTEQDEEYCDIHLSGRWRRLRLHDYHEIYRLPGLYEQLFHGLLRCDSPRQVVGLLLIALQERDIPVTDLSVLDVGAGNGMVAEELRRAGISPIVGIDLLPEAREAAMRDRPGIYDDYLVADLTDLRTDERARMLAYHPNLLITVAALGFGDIPAEAFSTAFNAIRTPGWVAFNIRDAFLNRGDRSGFSRLIRAMTDHQIIQLDASKRYVHRLNIQGRKIEYVAMIAKKLADVPADMVAEASPLHQGRRVVAVPAQGENMSAIEFHGVSRSFDGGETFAVRDFSLRVEPGELMVLVGSSGAGKTTALKMINRLADPSSGSLHVCGIDVQQEDPVQLRRKIGYVFQSVGLFPHMTVAENIAVTPRLLGWERQEIARRVDELMKLVGLPPDEFRLRRPSELSGGQQQRVGFARALAARPSILLLDEPFGALDPVTRDALQREFAVLHRQLRLTSLMVTHDMAEALLLADRIAVMRSGRLIQVGTPRELLAAPADPYVAALVETPRQQADRLEQLIHHPQPEVQS